MELYKWMRVRARYTKAVTERRHYVDVTKRTMIARCGMVYGVPADASVPSRIGALFARKCRKCQVSEARDLRLAK